ncbi:MAG: ferredoxin reductase family protein [Rhodobacteraceae bacterium]|nr:ferredoxin reductase family protein [Paracoccaceae bacterium]
MPAPILILAYLAIALTPLALAALQGLPPRSIWDELASGAGLLALVAMLVEFVLSGRFRVVSRRIGMDVTMRFHQLFARSALVFALIHPFLYRAEMNPPYPWDTTRQLTLNYDPHGLIPGIIAWVLLAALVASALARSTLGYRYETWRLMHGLGAVLVAGAAVLHAIRAGRYSADPAMFWLWAGLFGLAVLSLAVVYVLKPLAQTRRPWVVTSVKPAARATWEVRLRPEGHAGLSYEAGQFAWLNIGHSPFSLCEHPFSISSAPGAGPEVSFLIKELGDFTHQIGQTHSGTRAYLDGPHGNLSVTGHPAPGIALIAGGVGLAPLIGILREMRATGDERPAVLIYGNRTEDQIAHRDELHDLATRRPLSVSLVLSEPGGRWSGLTGMIDRDLLAKEFGTAERRDWLYVLCGPPPMLDAVEPALIDLGIPPGNILSERFAYD